MDDSIKSSILRQIEESAEHSIFFLTDFARYGSLETVRKVLTQAHIMGLASRVAHGIYAKPKTSRFGDVPPSMEVIAKEIAKRDHAQIMPTGITAANLVGLSTQVPMVLSYLTSGSSRTVRIGNRAIRFRHAAPRNFAFKGTTVPLIVQALKDIGEKNVSEENISAVSSCMRKANDKRLYKDDILLAPQWIQSIVKPIITKICQDEALATTQQKREAGLA